MGLEKLKKTKRPRIGLYSMGLRYYWDQFPGLRERLIGYGTFIEEKIAGFSEAEVFNYGLVDCPEEGAKACLLYTSRCV